MSCPAPAPLSQHASQQPSQHNNQLTHTPLLPHTHTHTHTHSHKKKTSDPLTFEHLFPFYLIVTFFGLFVMFAGLRCMMDGSDDIITHNLDGSLNGFSWFWGFLCGFCRINPACAVMVSTCLVSLSLWSKHRAMSVKSGLSYLAFPDQGCRSPPPKGLHDVSQSAIFSQSVSRSLSAKQLIESVE